MAILGRVTLSGLDDGAIVILLEGMRYHPGFVFNPTTMQVQGNSNPAENRRLPVTLYKDATVTWNDPRGLESVESILSELRRYDETSAGRVINRV